MNSMNVKEAGECYFDETMARPRPIRPFCFVFPRHGLRCVA